VKPCTKCHEVKPLAAFRANPKMKLGADSWCRVCARAHVAARRKQLKDKPKPVISHKKCHGCTKVHPATEFAKDCGSVDGYVGICRECRAKKHQRYFDADPDAWRARSRLAHVRRAANPSFIVHKRVSARIGEWLGTKKGGRRCFDLLGYTLPELKAHLERQFVQGMGWASVGAWHIDHIVPLSSFRVESPEDPEFRRAWALTNLRPLWAKDNLSKSDKRTLLI